MNEEKSAKVWMIVCVVLAALIVVVVTTPIITGSNQYDRACKVELQDQSAYAKINKEDSTVQCCKVFEVGNFEKGLTRASEGCTQPFPLN